MFIEVRLYACMLDTHLQQMSWCTKVTSTSSRYSYDIKLYKTKYIQTNTLHIIHTYKCNGVYVCICYMVSGSNTNAQLFAIDYLDSLRERERGVPEGVVGPRFRWGGSCLWAMLKDGQQDEDYDSSFDRRHVESREQTI